MTREAIRLEDAVTKYLARRERRVAKGTLINDRSLVLRFQVYVSGNPWLSTLKPGQIEDFFYGDHDKGLNPNLVETSFNLARKRLNHFLSYCSRQGWCDANLMDDVLVKDPAEQQQRRFTATELCHLCAMAVSPQERILLEIACNTALRISDITALRMVALTHQGKLDLTKPTLDLDNGWLHVYIHKTKKLDSLPITAELDQALRAWLTHYATVLDRPFEPGMLLIPAKSNAAWSSGPDRPSMYKPYNVVTGPEPIYLRAVARAELPFTKGNGFHTLRRSFARLFYEETKRLGHSDPIRPVQAALHHATPDMTYHYIGAQPDRDYRNEVLRGQPFLSRLAADTSNVTSLADRLAQAGEGASG